MLLSDINIKILPILKSETFFLDNLTAIFPGHAWSIEPKQSTKYGVKPLQLASILF